MPVPCTLQAYHMYSSPSHAFHCIGNFHSPDELELLYTCRIKKLVSEIHRLDVLCVPQRTSPNLSRRVMKPAMCRSNALFPDTLALLHIILCTFHEICIRVPLKKVEIGCMG